MTTPWIRIAGRRVAEDTSPYLVAELSANHNGRIERAIELITAAKACGADAAKLQTYRPDTMTLDCRSEEFMIRGGLWDGRSLYDLYQEAHTPWEWHKPLFAHARHVGITLFSSPFDRTAVDLLEDLDCPAYKIASFEAVDIQLIRYAASTKKPMIISTGLAGVEEIGEAVNAAEEGGCSELALLHCVSGYPAPPRDYNLRTIQDLTRRFGRVAGLSDHTMGSATAIAAVAMGAVIIEKHFTLDRRNGGPDDSFSMEPAELRALRDDCSTAWNAIGHVEYGIKKSEETNIQFRRSLYFVESLSAGECIRSGSIRSIRPGFGVAPKYADEIVGRRVSRDVRANSAVSWDDIEST